MKNNLLILLGALALICGILYVEVVVFQWVWNYIADSTSLPRISKWMAFAIMFLISALFGAKARSS